MRKLMKKDGFTLIELMIVVVIIGILAAIAIPKFTQVSKNAKQAEAEPILKQIYTLQESYKAREGVYATTFAYLESAGWTAPNTKYFVAPTTATAITTGTNTFSYCLDNNTTTGADLVGKQINQDGVISDC